MQGNKKGSQYLTLLTKLQGKKKSSTKHAPCTDNVIDEELVKSAMTIGNSSKTMLLFVAWESGEDLRYITMFPEVIYSDVGETQTRARKTTIFLT
jgi:hypothetical protein